MENIYVEQIIDAIGHLTKKYGQPIVNGSEKDWGQVICRMAFGPQWASHPDFYKSDRPNEQDLINCQRLDRGEWPTWFLGCTKTYEQ